MDFLPKKLEVMTNALDKLRQVSSQKLEYEYKECPEYKKRSVLPSIDSSLKKADEFQRFYGVDTHYWIHFIVDALTSFQDQEYRLCVKNGRENQGSASNPQVIGTS